ncbi:gfo/Idh/MocA family oxidoreductase, partial [Salmonella enterica subsp. enterica serovar Weltevreden]
EMIASGKIGRVLELRGRGKEDATRGGGEDLWVLGTHIMDLIRLFGGDPTWCFAQVLQGGRRVTKADVVEGNEGIGPLAGDAVNAMYGLEGAK